MNTQQMMIRYMSARTTGATLSEIAKYAKVNVNTARKLLGSRGPFALLKAKRKCRVVGRNASTYMLRSTLANLIA